MKKLRWPLSLFVTALVAQYVAARALAGVDVVDELMVRGRAAYAAAVVALLSARAFAIFVAPAWAFAALASARREKARPPGAFTNR